MSGQVYVIFDAGRVLGVTMAARGRHGEHVEYGTRCADGVLRTGGWGHLLLPSRLGRDAHARVTRRDIKLGRLRVLNCAGDTL